MKLTSIYTLFFALVLFSLSSCTATKAYQDAQTAFSQGATLEMQERFGDAADQLPSNFVYFDDLYKSNSPIEEGATAAGYYASAMGGITKALKGEGQLKKVMALDNAYAIKALTHWRQGEYDEAREVAEKAVPLLQQDAGEENDIRDLAMMQALPGLINMDESYEALREIKEKGDALANAQTVTEKSVLYDQIKAIYLEFVSSEEDGAHSVVRGLTLIERAIEQMEGESAINIYLRNAQLAGMDNWGDILEVVFLSARRLNASAEEVNWVMEERSTYNTNVKAYLAKLEAALPNGKDNKLYAYWARLLAGNI
jgi:tetratricopeptide (TPR) repeat protein